MEKEKRLGAGEIDQMMAAGVTFWCSFSAFQVTISKIDCCKRSTFPLSLTFYDISGVKAQHKSVDDVGEEAGKTDSMGIEGGESDNFSDIDDDEV